MARKLGDIEKDAMELPLHERSLLVERLLSTLDQGQDIDSEELWLQEAEKRYQDYRNGKIGAKPADHVFKEARERIK
ncbi:MAG: addiction module protein [Planctomycetes bacterium]|nr:addiction module protein [Planctomycetota bacterium]